MNTPTTPADSARHDSNWYRQNVPGFPSKGTIQRFGKNKKKIRVVQRTYEYKKSMRRGRDKAVVTLGRVLNDSVYIPIDEFNRIYQRGDVLRAIPKEKITPVETHVEAPEVSTSYEEIESQVMANIRHYSLGATPIILSLAQKLMLVQHLREANFADSTIAALLSVVTHWLTDKTNALRLYSDWADGRHLPWREHFTPKALCNFAIELGKQEDKIHNFYSKRVKWAGEDEVLCCDSTRITTTAEDISYRAKGLTKQKNIRDQIGTLVILGQKSMQPLVMRNFAGDVPDIKTVDDLMKRMEAIQEDGWHATYVADKGYCSIENQVKMMQAGQGFLMSVKTNERYIQKAFVESEKVLLSPESKLEPGRELYGTVIKRKFTSGGKEYVHYIYVYRDREESIKKIGSFHDDLLRFKSSYKPGDPLYESHPLIKYFNVIDYKGEKILSDLNLEAVAEAERFMGYFADVASWELSIKEAYKIYKQRQCIENFFKLAKQHIQFGTLRGHTDPAIIGRQFISCISMSIAMEAMRSLSENQIMVPDGTKQEDIIDKEVTAPEENSKGTPDSQSTEQDQNNCNNSLQEEKKQKKKRGRKPKKVHLVPRTVFFSNVISGTQSITMTMSPKTRKFWLSEVTEKQHRLAALCGVPDAYHSFHPYLAGSLDPDTTYTSGKI